MPAGEMTALGSTTGPLGAAPWLAIPDLTFRQPEGRKDWYYADPAVMGIEALPVSFRSTDPSVGMSGRASLPTWAMDRWTTPQGAYKAYQTNPTAFGQAWSLGEAQAADAAADAENRARSEAGWAAGLEGIGDVTEFLQRTRKGIESDPRLATVFEGLEARASPDYRVVTPEARMAMELELARNINRAKRAMRGPAVGSGRPGSSVGTEAWLGATGAAGLAQIQGALAMENERARAQALDALGGLGMTQNRILSGLDAMIADMMTKQAMYEADPLLFESDPFMDVYLDWALAGEQESGQALEEGLEALEYQMQPNIWDAAGLFAGLMPAEMYTLGL